mgnify:CR=1 FL=1
MKAAMTGNDWQLAMLLNGGANIQQEDAEGWTALMYAVRYQNNTQIVKQLIDGGANTQGKQRGKLSPLLIAALYSQNPAILSLLLEQRSGSEEEVFHAFIISLTSTECPEFIRLEKSRVFLQLSVPINGMWHGMTPLMYACHYGDSIDLVAQLLQYGARTDIYDSTGKTAFDYAKGNASLPHNDIYWSLNSGSNKAAAWEEYE